MSHTYANRKRTDGPAVQKEAASQPAMDALRSGAARPTQEQMGHRVDLPDVMRSKMENAFGADLSAVKLYESEAVADAGAGAVTQGSNIAFAPGLLDFSSYGGQALLGHEISHVVSQARGEVTGSGFLNDHALEARADREGAMAAAGEAVAMPAAALSPVSASDAVGPMQAGRKDDRRQREADEYEQKEVEAFDQSVMAGDQQERDRLRAEYEKNRDLKVGRLKKLKKTTGEIETSNGRTTSPLEQVSRAKERHLSPLRTAETAPDRQTTEAHYNAYLENLGKIMGSLKDDELRAQPDFQRRLVAEYASAHQALYGQGSQQNQAFSAQESGSFLPGNGPDLLGTMYGRLMGQENIRSILSSGSVDDSIQGLNTSAHDSGVSDLMAMQYSRLPGKPYRAVVDYDRNFSTDTNAMRDLLSKVVTPAAGDAPEAGRIGEIEQELVRRETPAEKPGAAEPSAEEQSLMHMQKALEILQAPMVVPAPPGFAERTVKSMKDKVAGGMDSIQRSFYGMLDEHEQNSQREQEEANAELARARAQNDFATNLKVAQEFGLDAKPTESRIQKLKRKFRRK